MVGRIVMILLLLSLLCWRIDEKMIAEQQRQTLRRIMSSEQLVVVVVVLSARSKAFSGSSWLCQYKEDGIVVQLIGELWFDKVRMMLRCWMLMVAMCDDLRWSKLRVESKLWSTVCPFSADTSTRDYRKYVTQHPATTANRPSVVRSSCVHRRFFLQRANKGGQRHSCLFDGLTHPHPNPPICYDRYYVPTRKGCQRKRRNRRRGQAQQTGCCCCNNNKRGGSWYHCQLHHDDFFLCLIDVCCLSFCMKQNRERGN